MEIKELFGNIITKVYAVFGMKQGWLETADCLLELNNNILIGFPFSYDGDVWIRELPKDAERLFQNNQIVINRRISDFAWYEDDDYGGYFLLDDGSVITETRMSPQGTGQAGLNYYKTLEELIKDKGPNIRRLSKLQTGGL